MLLTAIEKQQLDAEVARAEGTTGAQIVAAIVPRSDGYPELPWIAFVCGLSLGMLAAVIQYLFRPVWEPSIVYWAAVMLGAGTVAALLCVFTPSLARLLLPQDRVVMETRQLAKSLFVDREVFATHQRIGVLLLTSVFERQIVVLPDKGLRDRVSSDAWQRVIEAMRTPLRQGQYALAMSTGIKTIEAILIASGLQGDPGATNELPDAIVDLERAQP